MKTKKTKLLTKTKIPVEMREKLIAAIAAEINAEFVPRHEINERSPSFPYDHRTMANRDSMGTGPQGSFTVGKHKMYHTPRLIEMLRSDLS